MSWLRRIYGGSPLHLVGHLVLIGIAAYALSIMFRSEFAPQPWNLVLWLLGGAVLHDLVLLPAYSAVNAAASRGWGGRPSINYVRVPLVVSLVLLLTYLPRIADGQPQNYERALGYAPPDYLARWLLITASLFAASLLVWVVRRLVGPRVDGPEPPAAAAITDPATPGPGGSATRHGLDP